MNYPDWQPATSRRETSANLSQHVGWRLYLRRHNTPQVANIAILAHLRTVVKRLFPFFQIYLSGKRTKRRSRSFESLLRLSARNISDQAPPLKFRFKIKFSPVRSIVRAASDSHCNPCCQQRIGNSHRSVAVRIRSRKGQFIADFQCAAHNKQRIRDVNRAVSVHIARKTCRCTDSFRNVQQWVR